MTGARWIREWPADGRDRWFLIQDAMPEDEAAEGSAWASVEHYAWTRAYTAEILWGNWVEGRENELDGFADLEAAQRWCELELSLNEVHFLP